MQTSKPVVLIVEDEIPIAQMERQSLEAAGFAVEVADSGAATLAYLEKNEVDLVILDQRLPDMNGSEVVEKLGERLQSLPVIMVTAHGDERLAADMLRSGVADYVCKDIDLRFVHELPRTVQTAIERFALRAENRSLQERLVKANAELEGQVERRTAELTAANEELRNEITERGRTEARLEWEVECNKALADLSNALIASSVTLEEVAKIVLRCARELTNSEHGYVSSIDPETGDAVSHTLTEMMGRECVVTGEDKRIVFPVGPDGRYGGLWGHALNTRKRFYTNSAEDHERARGVPEGHVPIRNFLTVPALVGEELTGQISVANSKDGYSDRELEAVTRLAELYALAVQRKRAEEALRSSRQELAVRSRVSEIFLTVPEGEMYGEVLAVVLDALKSKYGFFGFVDEDGALVCPSMSRDVWERCEIPNKSIVFPREKWGGAWGRALTEKKTFCVNGSLRVPEGHMPLTRALCAPILHGSEVLGIIAVADKATDYNRADQSVLEAIVGHIATILQARLQRDRQYRARRSAEEALGRLRRQLTTEQDFAGIIGRDSKMLELFEMIREVAKVSVPVLIQGESGTGKELVANAIHSEGPRADKPFVAVNCSALPESLLESELFGHVRGAFSGAIRDKKGRFELADGGTIFLDEVGDLSPPIQVALLRVLQEGTIERVGGERTQKVDVRVISATHKNLRRLTATGKFREDLYYRLCVIPMNVPPLRERCQDIVLLAKHVLKQVLEAGDREREISQKALNALLDYDWPGNVRELQNVIHYASVKCKGDVLELCHLPSGVLRGPANSSRRGRKPKLTAETVDRVLEDVEGNRSEAARRLGVSRATLYKYLEKPGND